MKRFASFVLAMLMALSLSACGGGGSSAASSAPVSSQPVSSTPDNSEAPQEVSNSAEDETPEEEDEPTMVSLTGDEDSLAIVTDTGESLVEFTLPSELVIYDEMKFSEENQNSMMIHDVMEGVSGRTIVEPYFASTEETPCEEYIDFYAGIVGIDQETAETFTRDFDGREVLICKQEEQTVNSFGAETCNFSYLCAVPVESNLILGFRIEGSYGVGKDLVFDDSTIDVLLSHCTF